MPTNCIEFSGFKSRKVIGNFNGGSVTSDAGVLLLREVEKGTHVLRDAAAAIEDQRHSGYVEHSVLEMITQRVFGICCGYEDGNDHADLRNDPLFRVAAGNDPETEPLASPSTLCRLEQMITRKDLVRLAEVLVEQFIRSYKKAPKEITLDFDATDDRIHGKQEGAFFHGYYYHYCFLPLYVFCGDKLLVSYLRPSNIDAAKHAWAILSLLNKRLKKAWPNVKIRFRADSGFCRNRMLRWCERKNIQYAVGIAKNSRLWEAAMPVVNELRAMAKTNDKKIRHFGAVDYAAKTWKRERRIIVKAEQLEQGENIRCVVTNMTEKPKKIYDDFYVLRGDTENRIKEQQLGLFADRTSCHRFLANQFRLILSSIAYVLMELLRSGALKFTALAGAQCSRMRTSLLKIGAIVSWNTRRIQVRMSEYYPRKSVFKTAARRLT